jgi:chloramphenicol 3-O-phosphotransferase
VPPKSKAIMTMLDNPWMRVGVDAWSLSVEASSVIALRMLKFAGGGVAAEAEARKMVSEKIEAGLALQTLALTGALGLTAHGVTAKTLTHYRRKVRANRLRLAKA